MSFKSVVCTSIVALVGLAAGVLLTPRAGVSGPNPPDFDVRVTNGVNSPVPVFHSPRTPFYVEEDFGHPAVQSNATGQFLFQVPEGKRLTVEHLSVTGRGPPDSQLHVELNAGTGPGANTQTVAAVVSSFLIATGVQRQHVASHPVRLYVEDGRILQFSFGSNMTGAKVSVVGYLEDAPSAGRAR